MEKDESNKVTLSAKEIRSLLTLVGDNADCDDDEITICDCPKEGVVDETGGDVVHGEHIAFFSEYKEEGVIIL